MYKYYENSNMWYEEPHIIKRIRKWFIWIGGLERANSTGWQFKYGRDLCIPTKRTPKETSDFLMTSGHTVGEINNYIKNLSPEVKKTLKRTKGHWNGPTPITLFGRRITIQSFGIYLSRKHSQYLCILWSSHSKRRKGEKLRIYLSPNGTPKDATIWYKGIPNDIKQNAMTRKMQWDQTHKNEL